MTGADFVAALLDPSRPPPAGVSARAGADVARRFAIYRNNVVVTLVEALASTFPAVRRLVGEEFFAALARACLDAYPVRSPILAGAGAHFAGFLESFPPVAALPYLPDVARLEYAMLCAYHAADAEPVGPDALAALPADRLGAATFRLHPSLRIVASPWAIVTLVEANRAESEPPPIDAGMAETALVLRPRLDVRVARAEPDFAAFVAALDSGATLTEAADKAAALSDAFDLSAAIVGLFRLELVVGFDATA